MTPTDTVPFVMRRVAHVQRIENIGAYTVAAMDAHLMIECQEAHIPVFLQRLARVVADRTNLGTKEIFFIQ